MKLDGWIVLPIWDKRFIIDGMTIAGNPFPQERIEIDEDMVLTQVKGKPERWMAHIRVETKEGEEIFDSEGDKAAKERILDFVSAYALKTDHMPTIQDVGASEMKESDCLGGDAKGIIISNETIWSEKDKKKDLESLVEAVDYFKSNEKIFRDKLWLKNALRYFYFAAMNERLEDKLINMIISLEALFFDKDERSELRYTLSLRAATLIGNVFCDKTSQVFDDIYELYKKRCDVVHGTITEVTHGDIYKLETYTKQSIKAFIQLSRNKSKKEILQLLNHCLVGKESADKLRAIIRERKWNQIHE